jgi:ribosomal-protein-alanine N-acetyltransferase
MRKITFVENYPKLETRRLLLRQMDENDTAEVLNLFSSQDITRFMDISPLSSLDEAKEIIEWGNQQFEKFKGFRLGIIHKENCMLIGTCGINEWVQLRGNRAEIGYDLLKAYWGKGYMREALNALLDYAFEQLQVHRIEAMVDPLNTRSQRLLEKMGFTKEGTLRDYAYWKGEFQSESVYSMLEHEWKNLRAEKQEPDAFFKGEN